MALRGLRVVEMAGLAPTPFAGMILADFGASVVRVDKPHQPPLDVMARNKRSISLSIKDPKGQEIIKKLCHQADILLDPYRPGIMEKFGLGPDVLCELNSRLVYARLTGYGQSGPMVSRAGHDINYLAISGLLSRLGKANEAPFPPVNLLADFAGGGLLCVTGILMALLEREKSGMGQVIDSSMTSGAGYVGTFLTAAKKIDLFNNPRGTDMLDGGAPFYTIYETSDGEYMAVGAIEPQFYSALLEGLGMDSSLTNEQMDATKWDEMRRKIAEVFASKTRQEWIDIFTKLDACVEPVLSLSEAAQHPHNKHTNSHSYDSSTEDYYPNPAPSLSRTPGKITTFKQPNIGENTCNILRELKYSDQEIETLLSKGIIYQSEEIIESKL